MADAYNDPGLVTSYLEERGFPAPSTDKLNDEVYDTLMRLDWLKDDPDRLKEAPTNLLVGILQILESKMPPTASDDSAFDAHFEVLGKGMQILKMRQHLN